MPRAKRAAAAKLLPGCAAPFYVSLRSEFPSDLLRSNKAPVTMRAWPVARSIFDAPLEERSERGDNKLDKAPEVPRQRSCRAPRGPQRQATWLSEAWPPYLSAFVIKYILVATWDKLTGDVRDARLVCNFAFSIQTVRPRPSPSRVHLIAYDQLIIIGSRPRDITFIFNVDSLKHERRL